MVLNLRTVEEIFGDYSARRTAIVRALTTEVDHFYELCDPEKENLCFYGHPNESWEVTKPATQILADVPEPARGINYFRDLIREDFLSMVAIHSDSWLISVAFLLGAHAHLSRNQRNHLFSLINDLPTIYEVVTEEKPVQDKPSTDGGTSEGSNGTKRSIDGQMETDLNITDDTHEDAEDEHNVTLCCSCGANNNPDEYWIACDVCQRWFHAMCATITPSTDESNRSINEYKCPFCCIKAL